MKALNDLSNTERGKLLADLFPEEIPTMLKAVAETCEELNANNAAYRAQWKNPLFTFDFWMLLSESCYAIIRRYKNPKLMSSRVFSDQLFYGHRALFAANCILNHAEKGTDNPKLKLAIQLLFDL